MVVPEFRMIQLLHDHYGVDERWRFNDTRGFTAPAPKEPVDLQTAASRIDSAASRDEVMDAMLAISHTFFRRVIFFIVREPWVLGWHGVGEGMDHNLAVSLRIPLDQPSVFRSVGRDKTVFIGRLNGDEESERFAKAVNKRANTNAALLPITVKGRVVNLIYGDNGATGNVKASLGDLMILLQKVPRAYLRIIRRRIAETKRVAGEDSGETTPTQEPEEA